MTKEDMENDYRREDNEMLVRRFVGHVGYDYIQHHKKNTPQIHPDFSDETRIVWKEIEERMHEPVAICFDREKCIAILKEGEDQKDQEKKYRSQFNIDIYIDVEALHAFPPSITSESTAKSFSLRMGFSI